MIKIKNSNELYKYIYSIDQELGIEKLIAVNSGLGNFRESKRDNIDIEILYHLSDVEMYHLKLYLFYYMNKNKNINISCNGSYFPNDTFSKSQKYINNFESLWNLYKEEYKYNKLDILYLLLVRAKRNKSFLDSYFNILINSTIKNEIDEIEYFKLLFETGQVYTKRFNDYDMSNIVYDLLEEDNIFNGDYVIRSSIFNARALNSVKSGEFKKALSQQKDSLKFAEISGDVESYTRTLLNYLRLTKSIGDISNYNIHLNHLLRTYSKIDDGNMKNAIKFYLVSHYSSTGELDMMKSLLFSINPYNKKEYDSLFNIWIKVINLEYMNIKDINKIVQKLQVNYVKKFKESISNDLSIDKKNYILLSVKETSRIKNFNFTVKRL